jgi:hypothetical protein
MNDNWEKELNAWLQSEEHKYSCASWNEGLDCCLDQQINETIYGCRGRDFIRDLIARERELAVKEFRQKLNDEVRWPFKQHQK